jgi:uracil phosphoribosyltransferase
VKNLVIIDHPLVKRDLTILRNKKTPSHLFRAVLHRTARVMAYEVSRELKTEKIRVMTPLEKTDGYVIKQPVVLVPILRAGLGLLDGFNEIMPDARVGHIGLYRNEKTLYPVDYYFKVPGSIDRALVLVLDPMLATGGSGIAAVASLKERGARDIRFVSLVAAPEGVKKMHKAHPDIRIYTCSLDRGLNRRGYILPGLGDAGDRIFGTE